MSLRRDQERDQERAEFLAGCLSDFRRFCGLLKIPPIDGGERVPLILTPIQRQYNDARTSRDILLKGRQVYVTTLECARDVWWFLTRRGAHVVIVCQSDAEQAAIRDVSQRKIAIFFDCLRKVGLDIPLTTETSTEWAMAGRDASMRVITAGASEASAQKKGRGGTINRLHATETAFWEYGAETLNALLESVPRLNSEVVYESTPNGASGFFYEQWRGAIEGRTGFTPHFLQWWRHHEYAIPLESDELVAPQNATERILVAAGATAENVKWWRWKSSADFDHALQEFPSDPETCFLLEGRGFFDARLVASQLPEALTPIAVEEHGLLRIFQRPQKRHAYVIGADPSEGVGGDPSGGIVYDRSTGAHVATIQGQIIPWEFAALLARVGRAYNGAVLAVERNNHGHAVLQALQQASIYRAIYYHTDDRPGWPTHEITRAQMLDAFDAAHRAGAWTTPDARLLGEMRSFIVGPSGKPEATRGRHDDLVMAAAIGWAAATRPIVKRRIPAHLIA